MKTDSKQNPHEYAEQNSTAKKPYGLRDGRSHFQRRRNIAAQSTGIRTKESCQSRRIAATVPEP